MTSEPLAYLGELGAATSISPRQIQLFRNLFPTPVSPAITRAALRTLDPRFPASATSAWRAPTRPPIVRGRPIPVVSPALPAPAPYRGPAGTIHPQTRKVPAPPSFVSRTTVPVPLTASRRPPPPPPPPPAKPKPAAPKKAAMPYGVPAAQGFVSAFAPKGAGAAPEAGPGEKKRVTGPVVALALVGAAGLAAYFLMR